MELTPKDLRAMELSQKFNSRYLATNLDDYHLFVDTLLYLHEAIAEQQVQVMYWQKDSETLFYKFTFSINFNHKLLNNIPCKKYDMGSHGNPMSRQFLVTTRVGGSLAVQIHSKFHDYSMSFIPVLFVFLAGT